MRDDRLAETAKRAGRRQVAAVVAGNALEFYDFLTYSFFAAQIGRSLFPTHRASDSLLLSLAAFGSGFLTRPLGGIVIGALADRRGRKPAMLVSFVLMGVAITGLALTPSYAVIGPAAGVIAVLFRMVQGFALGGELGPSTAYLMEAAPVHQRGFYVSFQFASQNAAILVAGVVGLALSSLLSPDALQAWGWRAAMLLGVMTVPFGLLLRRQLAETLPERAATAQPEDKRSYAILAIAGVALFGACTINVYTLNYLTTYAQVTLHMAAKTAFLATVILGLTSCIAALASGRLSDRFGRKPTTILAFAALVVVTVPGFWLMSQVRTPVALFAATAVLSILAAIGNGPVMIMVTEQAPAHLRARSLALIYALAIAVFGGSDQLVVAWLIRTTGDPTAPAWYMTIAVAVGLATMLALKESAPAVDAAPAP